VSRIELALQPVQHMRPAAMGLLFEGRPLGAHFMRQRQARALPQRLDLDADAIGVVIVFGDRKREHHQARPAHFEKYAVMNSVTGRPSVDDEKMAADARLDICADDPSVIGGEEEAFGDFGVEPGVVDLAGRGIVGVADGKRNGLAGTHQHSSVIGPP